jgi:hypothetical protein
MAAPRHAAGKLTARAAGEFEMSALSSVALIPAEGFRYFRK